MSCLISLTKVPFAKYLQLTLKLLTLSKSLTNPKFMFLDEADMFRKGEQDDVCFVSERYIGKSDPFIVMVSTPNAPDGLFEKIENEP